VILLANILKTYRGRHALLQKEVADVLGISREHYAQIESGHVTPSFKLLQRVSERLDLNFVVVMKNGEYQFEDERNAPRARKKRNTGDRGRR